MTTINLGNLKFTWKGEWQTNTLYNKDDIVKYGAGVYVCIDSHTTATTFAANSSKFELMVEGITFDGTWDAGTLYQTNDIVSYGGSIYVAVAESTGVAPSSNAAFWSKLVGGIEFESDYDNSTQYQKGDIVKYGGYTYIALQDSVGNLPVDVTNWEIVNKGYEFKGVYDPATEYLPGELAQVGGKIFASTLTQTGVNPEGSSDWFTFSEGVRWQGVFNNTNNYETGDIVSFGGYTYIALQTVAAGDADPNDVLYFQVYGKGFDWKEDWDNNGTYKVGDVVRYGGRTYTCIQAGTAIAPTSPAYWELFTDGQRWTGEFIPGPETTDVQGNGNGEGVYIEGDIVAFGGNTYICIQAHSGNGDDIFEPPATAYWSLMAKGMSWKGPWDTLVEYELNDVAEYAGSSYISVSSDNIGNRPDLDTNGDNWQVVAYGDSNAVLTTRGDLVTRSGSGLARLPIGPAGAYLYSDGTDLRWGQSNPSNTFYVSLTGDDTADGRTPATAWRTLRHACDQTYNEGQCSISIFSGTYEEQCPMKVGRGVVIEGQGLGAVTISPNNSRDEGFGAGISDDGSTPNANSEIFHVNNGCRIRNLVFKSFSTGAVCVSLDPGTGPDDTSVWITSQSPYIQNCTSFTPGGTGMLIDGALHNGGYKSMVANDWTQINSDGIGIHARNDGRTELVSVFTYYCDVGYLAETGAKIRSVQGSSAYGEIGVRATGFSQAETPLQAVISLPTAILPSVNVSSTNTIFVDSKRNDNADFYGVGFTNPAADTGTSLAIDRYDNTASNIYLAKYTDTGDLDWHIILQDFFGYASKVITIEDSIYVGGAIEDSGTQKGFIAKFTAAGALVWQKTLDTTDNVQSMTHDNSNIYIGANHNTLGVSIFKVLSGGTVDWVRSLDISGNVGALETTAATFTRVAVNGEQYENYGGEDYRNNAIFACYDSANTTTYLHYISNLGVSKESIQLSTDLKVNDLTIDLGVEDGIYIMAAGEQPSTGSGVVFRMLPDATVQWQKQLNGADDYAFYGVYPIGDEVYTVGSVDTGTDVHGYVARWNSNGSFVWQNQITSDGSTYTRNIYLDGVNLIIGGVGETNNAAYFNLDRNGTDGFGTVSAGNYALGQATASITDNTLVSNTTVSLDQNPTAQNAQSSVLTPNASPVLTIETRASRSGFAGIGRGISWDVSGLSRAPKEGSVVHIEGDDETYFCVSVANFIENFGELNDNNPNAVASLNNNKTWMQEETIGWITDQIANATGGSIWDGFTYDSDKCKRDIGLIIDALVVDLDSSTIGSFEQNDATIDAALTYWSGAYSQVEGQEAQTVAAINYMKSLVDNAMNKTSPAQTYSSEVQNTTHATVEAGTQTFVEDRVDIITNVITNGPSVAPAVTASGTATISIEPAIPSSKTPDDGNSLVFREAFSQVRMTGHDFLDIGTGGFADTNYPVIIQADYTQQPSQDRETDESDGGRVFYVTTDQDGNFRVGNYFKVEQATGRATLSSQEFDLSGLNELQLGSIKAGRQGATINEFSTDGTFSRNTDSVVPTEKATKTYVDTLLNSATAQAGLLRDEDGNTRVLVEKTSNDNTVRIETDGVERLTVSSTGQITAASGYTPSADQDLVTKTWVENNAGGRQWQIKDANYTAVNGDRLFIDTVTNGSFTVTLPATPVTGDTVRILDVASNLETAPLFINGNGNDIMGDSNPFTVDSANAGFALVFVNSTYGWRLLEA